MQDYHPDEITIMDGLNLFHIAPKNVKENREDYDFLKILPKSVPYAYDVNDMKFGFTEFYANYLSDSEILSQKLQFETKRPLKLVHFKNDFPIMISSEWVHMASY